MFQAAKAVITAALIFGFGPAVAATVQPPPARYDYEPKLPVRIVKVRDVQKVCLRTSATLKAVPRGKRIYACSGIARNGLSCVIFMPRRASVALYAELYRHERAHCNGWRH